MNEWTQVKGRKNKWMEKKSAKTLNYFDIRCNFYFQWISGVHFYSFSFGWTIEIHFYSFAFINSFKNEWTLYF